MSDMTLLVMCPIRGRRSSAERLLKSFEEATDSADLVFITDGDDDTYEGMDWGTALQATLTPRDSTSGKINQTAEACMDSYDALMFIGDDHLFSTPHWDTILLGNLEEMGGTGMVYGDDKRRTDIPETIVITSDIVKALGWFMNPVLNHYYVDNSWADLGTRAGLLKFVPEVELTHLHYSVNPEIEHDELYKYAEKNFGASDLEAYRRWQATGMRQETAILRRKFNKDIKWLFEKI